ncbi:MAG TPA: hypothetical protein PLL69_10945, partial [Gemmatimonadales bacterium]|nr:hypothetical protein [Gemmatimonadales bacterium]
MLWGAIRMGDEPLADRAWQRITASGSNPDRDRFLGLALRARFGRSGTMSRLILMRLLARDEQLEDIGRYLRLGHLFDIPDMVRQVAIVAMRGSDSAGARAGYAVAALMQGRTGEALTALDQAGAVAPDPAAYRLQAAEWRLLLPRFGVQVSDAARDSALDMMHATLSDPARWQRAAWTLAVVSIASGDRVSANRWEDSLRRAAARDPLAAQLAELVRSERVAVDSGPAGALVASQVIQLDIGDAG